MKEKTGWVLKRESQARLRLINKKRHLLLQELEPIRRGQIDKTKEELVRRVSEQLVELDREEKELQAQKPHG